MHYEHMEIAQYLLTVLTDAWETEHEIAAINSKIYLTINIINYLTKEKSKSLWYYTPKEVFL
jgi:hypothetical protein